MATDELVRRVLGAFQRNHNKVPKWAQESVPAWAHALRGYRDSDVKRTCTEMLSDRSDKAPPTVATFIARLEASPLSKRNAGPEGCEVCGFTGWRELAVWRERGGRVSVTTCAAACECPKGMRYSMGDALGLRAAVEKFTDEPFVTRVLYTTPDKPALSIEERMHPDAVARIESNKHSPPPKAGGAWATLVQPPHTE